MIVCVGDSNTWGLSPNPNWETAAPKKQDRIWTDVLQERFAGKYEVRNEGMCGRTLATRDTKRPGLCVIDSLPTILSTTQPTKLLVLMLGTNDLKRCYQNTGSFLISNATRMKQIKEGMELAINLIQDKDSRGFLLSKKPKVLVVAPPQVLNLPDIPNVWTLNAPLSRQLGEVYEATAQKFGALFFDAGKFASPSPIDGVHLDQPGHEKLGNAMAEFLRGNGI